jgi:RNA polymerase sigma-54 factor
MSGMGMGLGMRQDMRMSQTLAPRMIQSMEILQLASLALQERIEQEMEENPCLELRDGRVDDTETVDVPAEENFNADAVLKHDETGDLEFARMEELNKDWDDHFDAEHRPSRSMADELGEKKMDAMQNLAASPVSLQDHLAEQLPLLDLIPEERDLCIYVISQLDENGYLLAHDPDKRTPLPVNFDELASSYERLTGQHVTVVDVEDALLYIQKLDPAGVGARDTKECLLLQVDDDEMPNAELIRALIRHHLEDVAANRLPVIQKRTGADAQSIKDAIEILRRLDPKPGAKFAADNTRYVTPDVAVERGDDGEYTVRLLDDWVPQPRISKRYMELARDKAYDPKAREYLKRKLTAASWLIDAIEQRRNTLTKVTREIVAHQRAFLDNGPDYIQPLKMEQIAEKVGVHVTTVSRAVDDKWVETPRGVFPLKRFFGGGTRNSQTGQDVAWETIKQKLQEFIAGEDKSKPLSDDQIMDKFEADGLKVARRTVTKYREALNIPSSRQRKAWGG